MKPRVVPLALARPSSLFRAVSNWRRLARRVRSSVTASSSTSCRSQALRRAREACAASCSRVAMTLRSTRLLAVRPNTPISTPAGSPSVNSGKMATPAASGSQPRQQRIPFRVDLAQEQGLAARPRLGDHRLGADLDRISRLHVGLAGHGEDRVRARPVRHHDAARQAPDVGGSLGQDLGQVAGVARVVERDGEVVEGLDVRAAPPELALVDGAEGRGSGADQEHRHAEGQRALGVAELRATRSVGGRRGGSGARPPPSGRCGRTRAG